MFVESLDRCFENVCELDLVSWRDREKRLNCITEQNVQIFHFDEVHAILSEIIQGGLVLETNMSEIVAAINEMNKAKKAGGVTASSLSLKATESLRGFRH